MKFMPHRAPEHLRYSLRHSSRRTPHGWTWKQDYRPRHQPEPGEAEMEAARNRNAEAPWAVLFRGANNKILSEETAPLIKFRNMRDSQRTVQAVPTDMAVRQSWVARTQSSRYRADWVRP